MRITAPVLFAHTGIPHKNGHGKIDGFYLLIVDANKTVGMMSTVLRLTDLHGNGIEFLQSLREDALELQARNVRVGSSRPMQDTITGIQLLPLPPACTHPLRADNGRLMGMIEPANIRGAGAIIPHEGFSVEMETVGNLVCPHCLRKHQLGRVLKADKRCLCEKALPDLRIPFSRHPSPPSFIGER